MLVRTDRSKDSRQRGKVEHSPLAIEACVLLHTVMVVRHS